MTEQQTEPTDQPEPAEVDQVEDQQQPEAGDDTEAEDAEGKDEGRRGNPEAAKWRTRFREAEAERDQLRELVTKLQRAEVVRQATGPGKLIDGEDVFRVATLADLLDDDGLNADQIAAAVEDLVKSKPHLAQPRVTGQVGLGDHGSAGGPTWSDVIRRSGSLK